MPRYKITIEYDGTDFVGWQRQDNGLAVQQAIEEAIAGFCGERVTLNAAGRTDAGVHALGQVAHFDLVRDFETDTVRDALNFHLKPAPISVLAAQQVDKDFHARFQAIERVYLYRIANRRAPLALDRGRRWWVRVPLDAAAMAEAARVLVGRHDFTTFRSSNCQAKSPLKTLDVLHVRRQGDEILIEVRARSFLHHQVRNLAGTLKLVGEGKWTAQDVRAALEARDRAAGGPTAPPGGLYLVEVKYESAPLLEKIELSLRPKTGQPEAPRKHPIAGYLAVGFGFAGIFGNGLVFAPLALLASVAALFMGQIGWGIAGLLLAVLGVLTTPTILLYLGFKVMMGYLDQFFVNFVGEWI